MGSPSTSGSGSLGLGPTTRTIGYSKTVTVTATLRDPNGGRSEKTVKEVVTTEAAPPAPRTVTVFHGDRVPGASGCSSGYYGGGDCIRIGVKTTGFEGQSYQCVISSSRDGYLTTWNFTGNVTAQPGYYYGFQATITANCGGIRGSMNW